MIRRAIGRLDVWPGRDVDLLGAVAFATRDRWFVDYVYEEVATRVAFRRSTR